jgi:hypothetical protein
MATKIDSEALLVMLEKHRTRAFKSMTEAEADGNSDYAYYQGVWEGINYSIESLIRLTNRTK